MKSPNRIERIFATIDCMGSAASFLSDMSATSIEGLQLLSRKGKLRYGSPDAPLSNAATRSAQWSNMTVVGSPASISFL